jgi:hypothetical protein
MNKVRLRNRIVDHLNAAGLGCFVESIKREFAEISRHLVWGVAKDGRAILIYPIGPKRTGDFSKRVATLMEEFEKRGAIVGCAASIGDAWDIVYSDETVYKRKKRTYNHKVTTKKGDTDESE